MRALVLLLAASPLLARGRTPDLAGTWILNTAKSHSWHPLPASRTLVIARDGRDYVFHQNDGTDSTVFRISPTGVATTVDQSDGSTMRYLAHLQGDTIVYVVDMTGDQGQFATCPDD